MTHFGSLVAVVLAGGKGTRFWPLSRAARPKQFLSIVGDSSLLQMTVDRLRKLEFVRDIFVICDPPLAALVRAEVRGVAEDHILEEPEGKNTAPSIGLAALHIERKEPNAVMGVFPSDHLIIGHAQFEAAIRAAVNTARRSDMLVTFGVVPTSPRTGYGYIQYDRAGMPENGSVFRVKTFAEKPSVETAKSFLESGDFLWNSGMFVWTVKAFLRETESRMPELARALSAIRPALGTPEYRQVLSSEWDRVASQSVDYGILEGNGQIAVVRSEFEWSDVGSWDVIGDILPKGKDGNVLRGEAVTVDSRDNVVVSNGRLTAVVGLDRVVVVNLGDATLVCSRDRVEEIRQVVELLRKSGKEKLL